jgi:hypothetical protein
MRSSLLRPWGTVAVAGGLGCAFVLGCGGDGTAGGAGPFGAIPPSPIELTSGGRSWEFRQGEVLAEAKTISGERALNVWVMPDAFDRCSLDLRDLILSDRPHMHVTVPPALGTYDLASMESVAIYAGLDLTVIDRGTLQVMAIDGSTLVAGIDGSSSFGGSSVAGTFVVDSCGFTGQNLFTFQRCDVPPSQEAGGYVPSLQAVSPGGRVAVAAGPNQLAVYTRNEAADGTCQYVIDSSYGAGGMVAMPKGYRQSAFDAAERLYVTTNLGYGANAQQPASIFRIEPGKAAASCRFNEKANASITDDAPSGLLILPDGSAAYLFWGFGGEARLDLSSPSISDRDLVCDFVWSSDPAHYTAALSAYEDGLVFLRTLDTRTRAAVTDFALVPKRYFGGSPSGLGQQGFTDVKLLARCPAGFCAASSAALKVFDASGQFLQMIQFSAELGAPLEPAFLVEGKDGTGYLRGFLSSVGSTAKTDVVYKMTSRK